MFVLRLPLAPPNRAKLTQDARRGRRWAVDRAIPVPLSGKGCELGMNARRRLPQRRVASARRDDRRHGDGGGARGSAIAAFRSPVEHAMFGDTGPVENDVVAVPRSSVWTRQDGGRRFLADPGLATIYSRGQRYWRGANSADGDRCDWFAVSREMAREIAEACDPSAVRARLTSRSARLDLERRLDRVDEARRPR